MQEFYINMFGILSNIFYTSALLPQIYKILKTKKVEDISLLFLFVCILGEIFYVLYGTYRDIGNVIYAAYISIFFHSLVGFLCYYYKKPKNLLENIKPSPSVEVKIYNIETII